MKSILILITLFFLSTIVNAQTDYATQLANKIAQKMKDSLNLTDQQKKSLKDINMSLHNLKQQAWKQHPMSDSLRIFLQRAENKRDTLYSAVLTHQQYLLYKQKKRYLVNNN